MGGSRPEVSLQFSDDSRLSLPFHAALTHNVGRYTKGEFEDLCFDFGIELDEDTEEEERPPGVNPELKIGQSIVVNGTDGGRRRKNCF